MVRWSADLVKGTAGGSAMARKEAEGQSGRAARAERAGAEERRKTEGDAFISPIFFGNFFFPVFRKFIRLKKHNYQIKIINNNNYNIANYVLQTYYRLLTT